MGYNLTIGEFHVETYPEERHCCATAKELDGTELGAPEDSTGAGTHGNDISPSYIAWAVSMRALGLYEVFFGDGDDKDAGWTGPSGEVHEALICSHPGAYPLTPDHAVAFDRALDRWRERGEELRCYDFNVVQGESRYTERPCSEEEYKWNLRRAEWLAWWTGWALKNCKYPTFANS